MKTCTICGARVRNRNPKTTTCDPICTRAKHAGRKTRQEQIWADDRLLEADLAAELKQLAAITDRRRV